jgi:hypothetical protein
MSTSADVNEDFVDMARVFVDNGVEFLIVGAYALAAHGFPRTTGDIDMLVRPTPENAARVWRALVDFGAPVAVHGVTQRDFEVEEKVYQLGLPPRRIDILTSISGVSFDEAAADAIEGNLGSVKVRFIGKAAMARNKLASGRAKDLADAELLQSGE